MVKKITLYTFLLASLVSIAQISSNEQQYNGFSSRSFMKFNRFLTVPTFSLLHENRASLSAIVRNTNVTFEDAPRTYIGSYSGKMRENVGAGIAIYQQEVGVFKDFGAIANYAYQIQMGGDSKLTFGFNFAYSRRSADGTKVLSQTDEPVLNNFQDIPVINFQPAVTASFGKIDVGLFFENLADFNLKKSNFVTSFSDKIISAHGVYTHNFENAGGLFENTTLRFLGIARKQPEGFGYAGNVIVDLPKAGWVKAAYDKTFGIQAGLGVNLSENLALGFSYEKGDIGATNEVGLIYRFGKKRRVYDSAPQNNKTPQVEVILPENNPESVIERRQEEYKNPEHNDLSDEIRIAQDSINRLNRKVNEVLELLKNQKSAAPIIIRDTVRVQPQNQASTDTSLRRRSDTPWRNSTVTRRRTGGGGTAYYVALDQYKDVKKAKSLVKRLKNSKVNAKYIKDPKSPWYYVYMDKYKKKKDAKRVVSDLNGDGPKGFENDEANDLGIKVKSVSGNRAYVVKISFGGGSGRTYTVTKKQIPARVRTMKMMEGLEPGYYLVVNVYSKKAYADRFVDELRADNIEADYFVNPKTGYRHVYILKTGNREEIIDLYNNNLNGSYYDKKSIIHIR